MIVLFMQTNKSDAEKKAELVVQLTADGEALKGLIRNLEEKGIIIPDLAQVEADYQGLLDEAKKLEPVTYNLN
jgi:hypothetical protein